MKQYINNIIALALIFIAFSMLSCSDACIDDIDDWIDEQENPPLSSQAIECGGAGNITGIEGLEYQDVLYTGVSNKKVIYHVFVKQGETSTNYTFKFVNHELNDIEKTCYIVDLDLATEEQWKAEIMEKNYIADVDEWEFLLDQKIVPFDGNPNPNYAVSSYPNTPVVIRDCEEWGEVGEFKGMTIE